MKIGIITIHKSEINYGACLQCFALWKYLTNQGYDCEVIDLLRPVHSGYIYKLTFSDLKNIAIFRIKLKISKLIGTLLNRNFKKRERLYKDFNNRISYSAIYRNSSKLQSNPPIYDVYISGSDQIWNPEMPFDNTPYLLSFAPKGKKRIAYASSFAVNEIPSGNKEKYKNLLSKYDSLSTREKEGSEIVKNLIEKDIPVLLDPVFLLSPQAWKDLADKDFFIDHNYILVYSLHLNLTLLSYAIHISKKNNYKIILVNASYQYYKGTNVTQLCDVGPTQWISLINNAKIFLTDSFHGTAFAILFRTPFLSFIKNTAKTNNRILTLLTKVGLEKHVINENFNISNTDVFKKATFNNPNTTALMETEVKAAYDYLDNALNS